MSSGFATKHSDIGGWCLDIMMKVLVLMLLVSSSFSAFAEPAVPEMEPGNGYVEPFKILDNVYYVGDKWVSSYIVDTSKGMVLIDMLDFPYSKWIPINLKKLGLDERKISHIIVTHGHSDHVGGAKYLQSLYNTDIVITEEDFELAKREAEKSKGSRRFQTPSVNSFASDGVQLIVGDIAFNFYVTPGHTDGCLSVDFMAKSQGKLYRSFVVGGHSVDGKNRDAMKAAAQSNVFIDRDNFLGFLEGQLELAAHNVGQNLESNANKSMRSTDKVRVD